MLGLTFKPNTDDMRDAPSIPLIAALQQGGASVVAFDPVGREQAEPLLPAIDFAADAYAAADGADALVIVTEWDEFRALDLDAHGRRDARQRRWSTCATSTTGKKPSAPDWSIMELVAAKSVSFRPTQAKRSFRSVQSRVAMKAA